MSGPEEWGAKAVEDDPTQWGARPADQPAAAPSRISEGFDALHDQQSVPSAFIDRVATGALVMRNIFGAAIDYSHALGKAAGEAGIEATAAQWRSMSEKLNPTSEASRAGHASGALTGPGSLLGTGQGLFEAATLPLAPIGGAMVEAIAKPMADLGGKFIPIEEARDAVGKALFAMRAPNVRFGRAAGPVEQPIGGLPTEESFKNGADLLGERNQRYVDQNLRRMWAEDGIHPAEAVHDAQRDAFVKHQVTAPQEEIKFTPPTRPPPKAPDPLDLAMSGELTATRAKEIASNLKKQQITVENEIFGERADEWRKLHRQSDRAWDNADDAKARATDDKIIKLEQEVRLTDADENWLNGQGWTNQSVPEHWENLSRNLSDIEFGREDALRVVSSEVRYLPKTSNWSEMASTEQEAVISILSAMNAEKVVGRDPMTFLRDAFQERIRRYGGGADAHEVAEYQMQELANLLRNPLERGPKTTEIHMPSEEIHMISEGRPLSLSAAATDGAPYVPLDRQPTPPSGTLMTRAHDAGNALLDIGRDIQMKVAPMATGTNGSMAIVKDYMNTTRRNRWEWSRVDADIEKNFTPEQRARMWNAADEESVALQRGESREHQGLVTLEPAERAAVEDLQSRAQMAWLRARDLGMVEGEGLPAYTPRMVMNAVREGVAEGPVPLNGFGYDLRTKTPNMRQRKYMTVEATEAAAKAKYGEQAYVARDIRALPLATAQLEDAVAGRTLINAIKEYGKATGTETVAEGAIPAGSETKWFTVDHPAFKTWRPAIRDGVAMKDAEGNVLFEQVPLYIHGDFEGPLQAAFWGKTGDAYAGLMSLKGKTMSLIMNSPMIHNMVEFGRAFPAMPLRIFKAYFDGNRAKNDVAVMTEAIDAGLVPIGKRFFNQDITSVMESPDLTPGRSWTAKIAGFVPGLFDEAAGAAVKRSIDKAGDFWHNTLLWDRIADLQMGLYTNFRGDFIAKGMDAQTASRTAAHLANRYAGALPKEAMSEAATKIANLMLFSRSFTIGNLGVIKDAITGLPKDVLAQIERDAGQTGAQAIARRKAQMTLALDIGLAYAGYSLFQSMSNVLRTDATVEQEAHKYVTRAQDVMNEAKVHPLSLLQPFSLMEKLSATHENEPGRQDRIKVGQTKDGTAIYARNPVGKIGEEFVNYFSSPIDMLKKKEGTLARPLLQVITNDKGFGRKVYDPNADTPAKYAGNVWAIVKHFMTSQIPEGQINAAWDLVKGDGDPTLNKLQAFGPFAGVTFSKGAPGGPAVGELYKAREMHDFAVQQELPDIRKQIQRGDVAGAQQRMTVLGVPPGLQRFYVRTSQFPETRLSPRTLKDFYQYATPEQRQRLERARGVQP